ncbi:MAG: hypothetical protein KA226_09375 [Gemmatimonadales bacterium]|nr:hypothetical protein [Gemmatimonadales bacterium]
MKHPLIDRQKAVMALTRKVLRAIAGAPDDQVRACLLDILTEVGPSPVGLVDDVQPARVLRNGFGAASVE